MPTKEREQAYAERIVWAALRGRPRLILGFKNRQSRFGEHNSQPRAATEGRPYSTLQTER